MMFHKEGKKSIGIAVSIVLFAAILSYTLDTTHWILYIILLVGTLLFGAFIWFFRDPIRFVENPNDHTILSPCDGKVVVIEEVYEGEYFKEKRLLISVFMSPLNVHINWFPCNGTVEYEKYHPGTYLFAWDPKSSTENERWTTVLKNTQGEVMLRQIAGALARRIVNYTQEGAKAIQGKELGFIKFGSRVDLYLPLDAKVKVQLNDKVTGTITPLATWKKS